MKKSLMNVPHGDSLADTIRRAMTEALSTSKPVTFDFNAVLVTVQGDSDPTLISRDYHRALHGSIGKEVGPYPKPELTEEEIARDARVKKENMRKLDEAAEKSERAVESVEHEEVLIPD